MRGVEGRRSAARLAILLTALAAAAVQQALAQDDPLVVRTGEGLVKGKPGPRGGAQFFGIPFAQPPVGDLRWHEPLPIQPWSGVRPAQAYSAPCAQPDLGWNHLDAVRGKEDCLYLNVVTPEWPGKKLLPVMFWIHGGANEGGTAMSALYTDGTLPDHGVVLVSVNYRLGVFGFMAHPELTQESPHRASGNYGLMDQILALKWVIANIERFGGDPKNITVFGQSAGAMDTGSLMASSAKELFQKAIQESGAPMFLPSVPLAAVGPLREAEAAGTHFAAAMGAPEGVGQAAFLRSIPAADLIKRWTAHEPHQRFGPIADGWVLARSPAEVFAAGGEAAIPLLFGTTTLEFGASQTADQARGFIAMVAGTRAQAIFKAYGLDGGGEGTRDPVYGTAVDQLTADVSFRCPSTTEGRWHVAAHRPVFEYEFNRPVPGQPAAVHSTDLTFVMGYYPAIGNLAGKYTEADLRAADTVERYFTNFARTGNPNGPGLPAWPRFGASGDYVKFTGDGGVEQASDLRGGPCALFRELMTAQLAKTK